LLKQKTIHSGILSYAFSDKLKKQEIIFKSFLYSSKFHIMNPMSKIIYLLETEQFKQKMFEDSQRNLGILRNPSIDGNVSALELVDCIRARKDIVIPLKYCDFLRQCRDENY